MQLGLISPHSNAPTVISFLLNQIPFDGIDAFLPPPDAPELLAAPAAAPAGPDSLLSSAPVTGYTPVLSNALTLIKSAIRRCPQAARELLPNEAGVPTPGLSEDPETGEITCTSLEGVSANAAVQLLMVAEAVRLAEAGGLFAPTVAAVRWAFEHTPRNIPLTLMQYWGDVWQGEIAPLEVAYASARLARRDEGVRHACAILDFPQVRLTPCPASSAPVPPPRARLVGTPSRASSQHLRIAGDASQIRHRGFGCDLHALRPTRSLQSAGSPASRSE